MNNLTNLIYLKTKYSAEEIQNLIKDYKKIIHSSESSKKTENNRKLHKYIKDLINYSNGNLDKLNIPNTFDPFPEIQLSEYEAENLEFYHFLTKNKDYISRYRKIPNFILQQAHNHAESGPVHLQAKELLNELKGDNPNPLILLQDQTLPQYRKYPILHEKIQRDTNNNYDCQKLVITPDGEKALTYHRNLVLWDLENSENNILGDKNYSCYAADITPDGRWAITSDRRILTLWDLDEKKPVKTISAPDSFRIIIRPDGQMAAVISYSYLRIYDLSTGKVMKEISDFEGLYSSSITPDFKTLVWISDVNLIVFDLETEKIIKIIQSRSMMAAESTLVSPDATKVICFTNHQINYLWDIKKGEFIGRIGNNITDLTPDFKLAITRDINQGELLDISRLKKTGLLFYEALKIKTLNEGVEHFLQDSKITADGRNGVSLDGNSNICIWDLENGESLKHVEWDILKIILLPPGNRVAYCYKNYFEYKDFDDDYFMRPGLTVNGGDPVRMVSSSDGEFIFISKQKMNKLSVFHAGKANSKIHPEDLHREINCENYVKSFHLSPSDKNLYIFTLTEDKISKEEWDKQKISDFTGKFLKITLDEEHFMRKSEVNRENEINEYLSTLDGRWIFMFPQNLENSTGEKQPLSTFKVWDPESSKFNQFTMKGNLQKGFFSPNGLSMAIKTTNGLIIGNPKLTTMKKFVSGEYGLGEVARFPDINANILVFTPDARRLVTGDDHGQLYIINMESLQIERTIPGHQKEITDVKISPDARFFLSVSNDNEIKMWDLDTGNLLAAVPDVLPILSDILPGGFFASARNAQGVLLFEITNIKIDLPITTPIRMFDPNLGKNGSWEDGITAWCPWCWKRFPVETRILKFIKRTDKSGLKPQDYQNSRLVTECSHCNHQIRINPFMVDYSGSS